MRRRICSLIFVLLLMVGATSPALCAGRPSVICETGVEAGVIHLSLDDLDVESSDIYGVQVELLLAAEEYSKYVFTPSSKTAYSPDCTVEERQDGTAVIVYLTSRSALNSGSKLDMGRLDLGMDQMVSWDVLPQTASVILLDQHLRPMTGAMSGNLPVTATTPSNSDPTPDPDPDSDPNPTPNPDPTPNWPVFTPGSPSTPTKPSQPSEPVEPATPTQPEPQNPTDTQTAPFTDMATGVWYYDAVQYVYAMGIMSGTAADQFSPDLTTTRGMIVTMLHRLEGSPSAQTAAFQDVAADAYYAAPVDWASANGIVTGTGDGNFSPNAPITREQLATILYRYAQYKGLEMSAQADLGRFPDAGSVSSYAVDAMRWAVGIELIAGSDGQLVPGGNATRAQVATIFQRMCVNQLGMV